MGFWILVPGLLMGGSEETPPTPPDATGPILGISVAPFGHYARSQQPHGRIMG